MLQRNKAAIFSLHLTSSHVLMKCVSGNLQNDPANDPANDPTFQKSTAAESLFSSRLT